MYRDFAAPSADGRAPEMSLERAMEDQRLMDQVYATLAVVTEHFDIVIIGSGAGGGTMAHALAPTGARILIVERGDFVPQEDENWSPDGGLEGSALPDAGAVARRSRRASSARTRTTTSAATPSSGAACCTGCAARTSRRSQHADGVSPAWPIDYDTLAPYYDRAERLYQVHGERRRRSDRAAARAVSVPAGPALAGHGATSSSSCARRDCIRRRCRSACMRPGEPGGCILCNTCNSFPCRIHAKSDADVCGVRPAIARPNVTLWTNALRATG